MIKKRVDPITNKHGGFFSKLDPMWHLTSLLSRPRSVLSLQTNKRIKRKKMGARLA